MATDEHVETLIIGGGQAGLAVGYHLKSKRRDFLVLDANERVGDSWRKRWPSLRLYSPAKLDGLPGMPFPAPHNSYPTGLEMADYLESYVTQFELPVRSSITVDGLERVGEKYVARAGERTFVADNVVVATGVFQHERPIVPDFADELDPAIQQLHSADYRGTEQLRPDQCSWSARRTREATSHSRLRALGTRPSCPEGTRARFPFPSGAGGCVWHGRCCGSYGRGF